MNPAEHLAIEHAPDALIKFTYKIIEFWRLRKENVFGKHTNKIANILTHHSPKYYDIVYTN